VGNCNWWSGLLKLGSVRFRSYFQSSELDLRTLFKWGLGLPHHTYPLTIHAPGSHFKPDYTFLAINPDDSAIHVCSLQCMGISHRGPTTCSSCQEIGHLVERVEAHACKLPINIDCASMSHHQLQQKLKGIERILKKEKLWVSVLLLSQKFL